MPGDVVYVNEKEAADYAMQIDGVVIPVDEDGDGVRDGYRVVPRISSEGTRGPLPSEVPPEAAEDTADYLKAVEAAGGPSAEDELGYMHGGMNYTKRGPIKYSKGGAVRGRTFSGSY
jgi:hypothetical protein